jgi:hypothetical protein
MPLMTRPADNWPIARKVCCAAAARFADAAALQELQASTQLQNCGKDAPCASLVLVLRGPTKALVPVLRGTNTQVSVPAGSRHGRMCSLGSIFFLLLECTQTLKTHRQHFSQNLPSLAAA